MSAPGFVVSVLGFVSLAPGFNETVLSPQTAPGGAAPGSDENALSPWAGLGSAVSELGLTVSALGSTVS